MQIVSYSTNHLTSKVDPDRESPSIFIYPTANVPFDYIRIFASLDQLATLRDQITDALRKEDAK